MKRSDFRHLERLRVRWAEVDMQQVVFNGHYLTYFDTAITGYFRALALPWMATLERLDGDLFVRRATLDYAAPAVFDDQLEVGLRCARIGTSSLRFEGALWRGEQRLVGCELIYVFTTRHVPTPQPVPAVLRETVLGFEAGEAMVSVDVGDWAAMQADAREIRSAVFIREQGIALELESDAADALALHAVARNRLGMALATGRLLPPDAGGARIGRLAVQRELRGSGVGRQVLEALAQRSRERGDREVALHAQASAVPFYARAGFVERGPRFVEAGIVHAEMVRAA